MRILDFAVAPDGGTRILVLEAEDGARLTIGLDGRMDTGAGIKQLFLGASPDSPDARLLTVGGSEERRIVSLLEKWLDETQGFIRREALMEADQSTLKDQDLLDRLAIEFLLEVRSRDIA